MFFEVYKAFLIQQHAYITLAKPEDKVGMQNTYKDEKVEHTHILLTETFANGVKEQLMGYSHGFKNWKLQKTGKEIGSQSLPVFTRPV